MTGQPSCCKDCGAFMEWWSGWWRCPWSREPGRNGPAIAGRIFVDCGWPYAGEKRPEIAGIERKTGR